MGDLIVALKIIPTQPQATTSLGSEPLDNSVLGTNLSEENKENNPLVSTTSQISSTSQNPINSDDITTSTELHSDASNSSCHETEHCADKSGGSPADQNSHCVKSNSEGTPMEGIEEGPCNGNDSSNNGGKTNNDPSIGGNLTSIVTSMSTNSQVDMNMSDNEYSEKD